MLPSGDDLATSFVLDLGAPLDRCGVRTCDVDGEEWLCALVRFPVMEGLKLPEDEVIEIRQERKERTLVKVMHILLRPIFREKKYEYANNFNNFIFSIFFENRSRVAATC